MNNDFKFLCVTKKMFTRHCDIDITNLSYVNIHTGISSENVNEPSIRNTKIIIS